MNPPLEAIKDSNINSKVENAELDSSGKPVEGSQDNSSENKKRMINLKIIIKITIIKMIKLK